MVPIGSRAGLREQRAQDLERARHRLARDQHLGNEEVAALEPRPDLLECGDERLVEQGLRSEPAGQPLLGQGEHLGGVPGQRLVVEFPEQFVLVMAHPFPARSVARPGSALPGRPGPVAEDRGQARRLVHAVRGRVSAVSLLIRVVGADTDMARHHRAVVAEDGGRERDQPALELLVGDRVPAGADGREIRAQRGLAGDVLSVHRSSSPGGSFAAP